MSSCFYRSALLVILALLMTAIAGDATAQEQRATYRLGPGDKVEITVFGEDDLSIEHQLDESGILNYPFLGELEIEGLSVSELEKLITDGLKGPYLVDPDVTVSIKEYRSVFMYGEVQKPGAYPYQPGLTVEKAIALAGGFTERASRSKVVINRGGDEASAAVRVMLSDVVRPGDVVTVQQSFF